MGRQHSPFPSSVPAQFPNVPQQQPLTSPPFAALSFAHLGGDAGGNPQSPGASLICGILLSVVSLLFSDMKPKAEPAAWTGTADPWVPVLSSSGEPVPQAGTTSQQTAAGPWDFPLPPLIHGGRHPPHLASPLQTLGQPRPHQPRAPALRRPLTLGLLWLSLTLTLVSSLGGDGVLLGTMHCAGCP